MGSGVGMTRGRPLLRMLAMYPRWNTCHFNLCLLRYRRHPRHRQDKDRHVEVPGWLPG